MRYVLTLGTLILCLMASPLWAKVITYEDDVFLDANWTQTGFVIDEGNLSFNPPGQNFCELNACVMTANQVPNGGNTGPPPPDPFRTMTHWWGSNFRKGVLHVFQPEQFVFQNSDGTLKSITSIRYWEDQRASTDGNSIGNGVGTGLVVQQSGKLYTTFDIDPNNSTRFTNADWATFNLINLTAEDFFEVIPHADPNTAGVQDLNSHPDFSGPGGNLRFGYWRSNVLPDAQSIFHDIDNFRVEITFIQLPEPSTALMASCALVGITTTLRRRRRRMLASIT